jgi:hypothetical protein
MGATGTFQRMAIVEPIVAPRERADPATGAHLSQTAKRRKCVFLSCCGAVFLTRGFRFEWDSLAEARLYFESRGLFKVWDPRVLQAYIGGAIAQDPATVKWILKCHPDTEAKLYTSTMSLC